MCEILPTRLRDRERSSSSIKSHALSLSRGHGTQMIVERTTGDAEDRANERALIHGRVDPGARERCTGHIPRSIISSLASKRPTKGGSSSQKAPPLSPPARTTVFSLPSTLLLLLGPAAALINSIHRRKDSWLDRVGARVLCSFLGYIHRTFTTLSDSLGSIFKISNELWMMHGLAGLEFIRRLEI